MSITPNDIHNKDFSTKFKGFDPEEVNEFLDEEKKELEQYPANAKHCASA